MGVQRYARRDESIKGAEFALKQGKKEELAEICPGIWIDFLCLLV